VGARAAAVSPAAPDPHGGAALAAARRGADSLTSAARPAWRA